jgi:hypothetical protein
MRKQMVTPMVLAAFSAAALAMCSAVFGVGIARVFWAEQLRHARSIDEIRSRTEGLLRSTIESLNRQVEVLKSKESLRP